MKHLKPNSTRRKNIKKLLSKMNRQNQRFIPVIPPLIEMMDLIITEEELSYLLQMENDWYDCREAECLAPFKINNFHFFFSTMIGKGLIHVEDRPNGQEIYRLNAILIGWFEFIMQYTKGKEEEKYINEKAIEFVTFLHKYNFFPLRNLQNWALRSLIKPNQSVALMAPEIKGSNEKNRILVNTPISFSGSTVYPSFHVNELVEKYGEKNEIYVVSSICRNAKRILGDQKMGSGTNGIKLEN